MKIIKSRYQIIRDTREKGGWFFNESSECLGTIIKKMDTADYTLVGYENILAIEKKEDIAEFAQNINEVRFQKELVRLDKIQYAYLLLGFTMDQIYSFPHQSGIPRYLHKKLRVTTNYIMSKLNYYKVQYPNIQIFLCGSRGREVCQEIFREVSELEVERG